MIRGIAASLVVVHHVLRTAPGLDAEALFNGHVALWMRHLFLGDLAVTLFFVLSGASLAISSIRKTNEFRVGRFFVRRFFRIYPLYALIIILYFAFRPVYAGYLHTGIASYGTWLTGQFIDYTPPVVWITHLTMTFNLVGIPTNFNNALWSLPIEMQFYLLFPVMFFVLRLGTLHGIILLALLLALIYSGERLLGTNVEFLERAWEFGGGVAIGVFWKPISAFMSRRSARMIAFIGMLLLFELAVTSIELRWVPNNTFQVFFCFVSVGFALGFYKWKAQTRLEYLLVKIGSWSYSLYLIHNLVIAAFAPPLRILALSPIVYFLIAFPLSYVTSLAASRFLYERFERPFIRLGARYAVSLTL